MRNRLADLAARTLDLGFPDCMSTALASSPWPHAAARPNDDAVWRCARRIDVDDGGTRRPALQWVLRRNGSLASRPWLAVCVTLCAVSLSVGAGFWVRGTPVVATFAGLELLGIGLALAVCTRHAADRETVTLAAHRVDVERRSGRHVQRMDFRPEWLCVEPAQAQGSLVELAGQGRRMRIGRFLRRDQRAPFAQELRRALRRARAGLPLQDSELEPQR
jgi:uncharacterized membrane protein